MSERREIRERLASIARYLWQFDRLKYGEAIVVKEIMRVDDIAQLLVRTFSTQIYANNSLGFIRVHSRSFAASLFGFATMVS